MIAIVDYDAGNVRSVINALARCGATQWCLTSDPATLREADKVLLPGVGDASVALRSLRDLGLDKVIPTLTCPVLGICVGMQVLCRHTQEGDSDGLGIFDTPVMKFDFGSSSTFKVPHVGWNTLEGLQSPLFEGLDGNPFVYFVHSYYAAPCPEAIATTVHGIRFASALRRDNFFGTQFHPEKSGAVGERIIRNFLEL